MLRRRDSLKADNIGQPYTVRYDHQQFLFNEAGKCPADRLNAQANIIGNILTCHWQNHMHCCAIYPRPAVAHGHQEYDHLFLSSATAEYRHLLMREIKFMAGESVKSAQQMWILISKTLKFIPLELTDRNRSQCLAGVNMALCHRQSQEISGHSKANQNSPPVGQQFDHAHLSRGNIENPI